jgi:hypothetical protein
MSEVQDGRDWGAEEVYIGGIIQRRHSAQDGIYSK